jgi:hypothetical protein
MARLVNSTTRTSHHDPSIHNSNTTMDSDNEDIIRGVSRVEGDDEIEVRPNGKGTAVAMADDRADTEEQHEEAEDDEDDEEGGEEEYIVEEILGHRWDGDVS